MCVSTGRRGAAAVVVGDAGDGAAALPAAARAAVPGLAAPGVALCHPAHLPRSGHRAEGHPGPVVPAPGPHVSLPAPDSRRGEAGEGGEAGGGGGGEEEGTAGGQGHDVLSRRPLEVVCCLVWITSCGRICFLFLFCFVVVQRVQNLFSLTLQGDGEKA